MMNKNNLVQWQIIDSDNDTPMPWYTHKCLEWLKSQDWHTKNIFEWGGGWSTIWWAKTAKFIYSVEANQMWYEDIYSELLKNELYGINAKIELRSVNEGNQDLVDYYTSLYNNLVFDVFIVDGVLRYECIQKVLSLNQECILIVDNWQQAFVFMCPSAEEILAPYERIIFEQEDHTDNDGTNKWKTAVFFIK